MCFSAHEARGGLLLATTVAVLLAMGDPYLGDGHHGTRVVKVFLHISPEEQLLRFRDRVLDPTKRWKLSYEDFRNRKNWNDYEAAADDMFRETSSSYAPWHAISANSKKYARVETLKVIARRLSSGVDLAPAELDQELIQEAQELLEIDPALFMGGRRRVE